MASLAKLRKCTSSSRAPAAPCPATVAPTAAASGAAVRFRAERRPDRPERFAQWIFARPDQHISDVVPVPPEVNGFVCPAPNRNYNPTSPSAGVTGSTSAPASSAIMACISSIPSPVSRSRLSHEHVADAEADYDPATKTRMFPRTATVQYDFPAKASAARFTSPGSGDLIRPDP